MTTLALTQANYRNITQHALEAFPEECCGLIVRQQGRQEIVRTTNVQDKKHAEYPGSFPRTASTGYVIGPEAVPALLAHDRNELLIEAFYHSHPEHEASFSAEDRKQAMLGGQPLYPHVVHIVISLHAGTVKEVKAFRWDQGKCDFFETPLEVL